MQCPGDMLYYVNGIWGERGKGVTGAVILRDIFTVKIIYASAHSLEQLHSTLNKLKVAESSHLV